MNKITEIPCLSAGKKEKTASAGQTGLVFPAFDWAISPTHPEREERLLYTRDQLLKKVLWISPDLPVPATFGRI